MVQHTALNIPVIVAIIATFTSSASAQEVGEAVYTNVCSTCHEADNTPVPDRSTLRALTPRAILATLEEGRMREHGSALTSEQRRAVAEWLTGRSFADTVIAAAGFCGAPAGGSLSSDGIVWSGWGGDAAGTGMQPTERAGLTAEDVPGLELQWAFGIGEGTQMRSKPAVIGDLVVFGSQFGKVHALDRSSGCIRWMFEAETAVRGAIVLGEVAPGRVAAFFVDFNTTAYAVDVVDGTLLWKVRAGKHARHSSVGSPVVHDGRVIIPLSSMEIFVAGNPSYECCTSSGAVVALDVMTGTELWFHRVIDESAQEVGRRENGTRIMAPSGAIVWSSPTIDERRGLVYIGTGENYTRPTTTTSDAIVALDLVRGDREWVFQATAEDAFTMACVQRQRSNCPDPMGPDHDFGMAPILIPLPDGGEILVAGQKSGMVWGLDPDDDGAVVWSTRVGKGGMLGGVHWGMATDGRLVYVANADNPMAASGPGELSPGVFALDPATGEVVWATATPDVCAERRNCRRANSAAPSVIPGVVFAGGLDGHMRAYSTVDGAIIWDFDTATDFETVNGVPGRGGSIDGPAPVIAGGMVYVLSGYDIFSEMPGNVLLAFAPRR